MAQPLGSRQCMALHGPTHLVLSHPQLSGHVGTVVGHFLGARSIAVTRQLKACFLELMSVG